VFLIHKKNQIKESFVSESVYTAHAVCCWFTKKKPDHKSHLFVNQTTLLML